MPIMVRMTTIILLVLFLFGAVATLGLHAQPAPTLVSPLPTVLPPRPTVVPCNQMPACQPDVCINIWTVARPPIPIWPPCIATTAHYTQTDGDVDTTELYIQITHPEFEACGRQTTTETVHLAGAEGRWSVVTVGGETSCAKDEAPLAWAVTEMLNTHSLTPTQIYVRPLPDDFIQEIADLGRIPLGGAGQADLFKVWLPLFMRR